MDLTTVNVTAQNTQDNKIFDADNSSKELAYNLYVLSVGMTLFMFISLCILMKKMCIENRNIRNSTHVTFILSVAVFIASIFTTVMVFTYFEVGVTDLLRDSIFGLIVICDILFLVTIAVVVFMITNMGFSKTFESRLGGVICLMTIGVFIYLCVHVFPHSEQINGYLGFMSCLNIIATCFLCPTAIAVGITNENNRQMRAASSLNIISELSALVSSQPNGQAVFEV